MNEKLMLQIEEAVAIVDIKPHKRRRRVKVVWPNMYNIV